MTPQAHQQQIRNQIFGCYNQPDLKKSDDSNDIEKAEGSKGGKVIGHTKSGKPIYANHDHEAHKEFDRNDHSDAIKAHLKVMGKMYDKRYKKTNSSEGGILEGTEGKTVKDFQHHEDQAFAHTDKMKSLPKK